MLTIHTDTKIHKMSRDNTPVAFARSGDTVCFETLDCFGCQIQKEDQLLEKLDWSNINPATGPLFIEDAQPGDVLKVEILDIALDDHGVMIDGPSHGVTGQAVTEESLTLGVVNLQPIAIKKWISISDEAIDMTGEQFIKVDTLLIMGLGLVAFIVDTAGGVLFAKFLNLFLKTKMNPMIGAAGISAFPMAGRVVHKMALKEDPQNFLLMQATGVNVSGQIASVIAGGMILNFFG